VTFQDEYLAYYLQKKPDMFGSEEEIAGIKRQLLLRQLKLLLSRLPIQQGMKILSLPGSQ